MLVWLLMVLPFGVAASGSDSLPSPPCTCSAWKPSVALTANLSQTGYSTAAAGMIQYKRFALSLGGKMVVSKAHLFSDSPYGIVTGAYFFPNGTSQRFSGFINADYQLTFQGNNRSSAEDIPGHRVHEYTAGYGFTYRICRQLDVISAINFGRYKEVMNNSYTGEKVTFSGFNSLFRLGINYSFTP